MAAGFLPGRGERRRRTGEKRSELRGLCRVTGHRWGCGSGASEKARFRYGLRALLYGESLEDTLLDGSRTETYGDGGYQTYDEGFVIRTPDGSVFQITVKQEC